MDILRIWEEKIAALEKRIHAQSIPANLASWRALLGLLSRLNRLKAFDRREQDTRPLDHDQVVRTLEGTVSGIDKSLWQRLSALAPGQAIVSFPHMARSLLVAVDPTPARLRMVD